MIPDARLAELAAAAYDPVTSARWERGDVKVTATEEGGFLVIAPRGTVLSDWRDIERDIDCVPVEHPLIDTVHRGFASGADSVAAQIFADTAGWDVVIACHSLGGAIGLCLGGIFCAWGRPPVAIVTFGAPRVALFTNTTLPALLKGIPGTDWHHRDDPVPTVPVGFIHPRAVTQLEPEVIELPDAMVGDHSIAAYLAALRAP